MKFFVVSLLAGLVGVGLLRLFYRAVRLEWPSNYVSMTRQYGLIINRSVGRYLSFILLPVYLVSLLLSTTAAREGGSGLIVALMVGFGHSFANHGLAMFRILKARRAFWNPDPLLQLTLAGLSVAAALLGGLGPGPFGFVVPPIEEFATAVWTAVFVAVLSVVVLDVTKLTRRSMDLYDIARHEAPGRYVQHAMERSREQGADESLVLAVLYAENLQRPAWFRQLEYVKGRFFPKGTYGIMQVSSSAPISDMQSIDLAIERYFSGVVISVDPVDGQPDMDALRSVLRKYNASSAFVELAAGLYLTVRSGY